MWEVENINGDNTVVKKEFSAYGDAKAYSEWTFGLIRFVQDKDNKKAER